MNKKNIILSWGLIIVLFIIGFVVYGANKTPDSTAYKMMSDIFAKMGTKNVELELNSVGWKLGRYQTVDGKMMLIYRDGYTFTSDSAVGDMSIANNFAQSLIDDGFVLDLNNTSDTKWYGESGYSKGSIGCIIRSQIDVDDPSQIVDGEKYPTISTISCMDNVLFENKSASLSTTTATTTI